LLRSITTKLSGWPTTVVFTKLVGSWGSTPARLLRYLPKTISIWTRYAVRSKLRATIGDWSQLDLRLFLKWVIASSGSVIMNMLFKLVIHRQ